MSLFDRFKGPSAESQALQAANERRAADIQAALRERRVPTETRERLEGSRKGTVPWTATLTPAELLIARSHGLRPVASVSATCWMHYGWSWTEGHAQGWNTALQRLREEAKAAGANAVLDVKMRTVPLNVEHSMDFTLIGTAVHVEHLPPSANPIVATVPALEFVKLLEADIVPTGLAIGAQYDWLNDWRGRTNQRWMGNVESKPLSGFWELLRQRAHAELRRGAQPQGSGVLAHVNFSQMFEFEGGEGKPKRFLGRHIVVATTLDGARDATIPHDVAMVVDMCAGRTPLTGTKRHHQAYASNEEEGAI